MTTDESESGLPLRWALLTVALGLVVSYGMAHWSGGLGDPTQQLDTVLRRALVLTLGVYVVLGLALLAFCVLRPVRLVWHRGSAPVSVLMGLGVGAVVGEVMLAISSAANGHLSSDSRIEVLVGGGGALRILLALVTTAVLAPLVEETLFRGILAGSLLGVGLRPAVLVSALAFAAWHMHLSAMPYYTVMGLFLAWLWRTRGLLGSMSAHAAFNGVLLVAAVIGTSGSGHIVHASGLTMQVPGGWQTVAPPATAGPVSMTAMKGPGGAGLAVIQLPVPGPALTGPQLLGRMSQIGAAGPVRLTPGTARVVHLPAGDAVEGDISLAHQRGHVVFLPVYGAVYELFVLTGSSPAAERTWPRLLQSLTVD